MKLPRRSAAWRGHALAVCAFSIAALWCSRAVLDHPASVVTFEPRGRQGDLLGSDLRRGVAQLAYMTRALSSANVLDLFEGGMCFPSPASVTFGEHMLGEGIQGLPAHLVWNDPVVTYNFVVTLKCWIAALCMYALAYHWTGSSVAALIAGFLFGFHPTRLVDPHHPSVKANEWIPLIVLSLDLLFTRRRWADAFLLVTVGCLQLLESLYVLVQYALVVGTYGAYLLWRHRRAILELLPKLAIVAVALAAVGISVLGPFLETREVWGILKERRSWGFSMGFSVGHSFYPGSCLLLLAALGVLDRFFGVRTRRGYDPRIPLVLAGLIVAWFVFPWPIPWTGLVVPSLRKVAGPWIPGLDAIRATSNVFFGVAVPLGLLAAYGVCALGRTFGPRSRAIVFGLVAIACVSEVFLPAAAKRSFGRAMPSAAFHIRPPEEELAAVRDLPAGPVFDFPVSYSYFWSGHLSRYVLLGAYHGRRVNSCKASFRTPVQLEVNAIARRLPSPDAARELWALGFGTIIFHVQDVEKFRKEADRIIGGLANLARPHLVPIREGGSLRVFRLIAEGPVTTDVGSLAPANRRRLRRSVGDVGVPFGLVSGKATFRHPDPIQPTDFLVTWTQGERVVQSQVVRGLLPLALAAGRKADIALEASVPEIVGEFDVTLALADDPKLILAREHIIVGDGDER